ncbi:MAG: hypothetical protein GX557_13100 [Chloroflexi bacterium]|nr:hypothetical protein [Chloroflexota bacterium]
MRLPYAAAGSAGERAARWLNAHLVRRQWAAPAGAALGLAALALVLGTFLGPQVLLATGVALAVLAVATLLAREPAALADVGRGVQVSAAWLAVLAVVGAWAFRPALAALICGAWAAVHSRLRRGHARAARWLQRAGYVGAAALLLTQRQPLPAVAIALAGCAEEATPPRRGALGVASALPWFASALLLALAARYGS